MDTNQPMNDEIVFSVECIETARFLITESEKQKIKFNFGNHTKDGYMQISNSSEDKVFFDVFNCSITGELEKSPRQIAIDKSIIEKEICEMIQDSFSVEELKSYLFDFETEELYFNIADDMKETYTAVLNGIKTHLFETENMSFIKNLKIEGIGCLYVNGHPQSLIEAACFHSVNVGDDKVYKISLDLYQEVNEEGDRYFVFFPYDKPFGYRVNDLMTVTDETLDFNSNFNEIKLSTSVSPSVIKRKEYPLFMKKVQKISNNNFLDLYIEDPYEQREELFQELCKEAG